MCARRPEGNQVEKKKAQDGPALARVYCLRYSGWRQALKKQELKNTLFWWGGCSCGFVIAITIRGPDRFTEREGRREEKVCYSTRNTKGGNRERERDVGAWQCVCLPFFLFSPSLPTSCSTPPPPSIQSTADSDQESLKVSEWSPSCFG